MHGAYVRSRPEAGVSAPDPFDRLVDAVLGTDGHRPVWGQSQGMRRRGGFDERRFKRALRAYWGADADNMRVSLAVQDARFVSGVVRTVSEHLELIGDDRRRVAAAVTRRRLLGEPEPSLDKVDAAWRAWWPPPPGEDARHLFAEFIEAWDEWLSGPPR